MASAAHLNSRQIHTGDIIITENAKDEKDGHVISHCVICTQSGILGLMGQRIGQVAHAMGGVAGLAPLDDFGRNDGRVFRANGLTKAQQTEIQIQARGLGARVIYGFESRRDLARLSYLGSGGIKWYENLRTKLTPENAQNADIELVCSQFVVAVIQLALLSDDPIFINLDARATLPRTLRNYLSERKHGWTEVGTYNRAHVQSTD